MSTLSPSELQEQPGPVRESADSSPGAQRTLPLVAQGELPLALPAATSAGDGSGSITVRLDGDSVPVRGAPQLSDLGKRIEFLRVSRGISKQTLARSSGTSRQQLWRVMTGKSELTSLLCQRLASALDVDSRTLSSAALGAPVGRERDQPGYAPRDAGATPASLGEYLAAPGRVRETLQTLPSGEAGTALKRALVDALEDQARRARMRVPDWLLTLRGAVLNGEL